MRKTIDFTGGWRFAKTAEIPAVLPENWETVALPHILNAVDVQDGGNDYWRGTAMYCKAFPLRRPVPGGSLDYRSLCPL